MTSLATRQREDAIAGGWISPATLRERMGQYSRELILTMRSVANTPTVPAPLRAEWLAWAFNEATWIDESTDLTGAAWNAFWAGSAMDELEEHQRALITWRQRLAAAGGVVLRPGEVDSFEERSGGSGWQKWVGAALVLGVIAFGATR